MSNDWNDPELDALLRELADTDEGRAALAEEHRQLEKDLLRLADPLPPFDFVQQVMTRVATAPARAPSKTEVLTAGSIVMVTVITALALFTAGSGTGGFGLLAAGLAITLRDALVAMGSGLFALWTTAALPLAGGLFVTVGLSLVALRRLAAPPVTRVLS
jgi:hypothetical protein